MITGIIWRTSLLLILANDLELRLDDEQAGIGKEILKMMRMIYEDIIEPIQTASGGNASGMEIIAKTILFLIALFAVMYGIPLCMVTLG